MAANKTLKKTTKTKECSYEELKDDVLEWFSVARATSFPISGPIVQAEALKIAEVLKFNDFKASNGWLRSFKTRNNISFQSSCGESKSVNEDSTALWKTMLSDVYEGYEAKISRIWMRQLCFSKLYPIKLSN